MTDYPPAWCRCFGWISCHRSTSNGRLLVSPGQTAYEVPSCSLLSVFCNFLCQTGESQSWLYWERSSGARHYPKSAGYNNNAQLLLVYGLRSDCEVKYLCNLHRRLIATAQGITSGRSVTLSSFAREAASIGLARDAITRKDCRL